jgi:nitrate/nitrite transport system ATP-binding protein
MVTHDVDEALFLADRIVMMTNGPAAKVGIIIDVPFARPRRRVEVMEHPMYYELRGRMITFLEEQDDRRSSSADQKGDEDPSEEGLGLAGVGLDIGEAAA